MSLWNCAEHGLHGPCPGNVCPTCGKPMQWATIATTTITSGHQLLPSAVPIAPQEAELRAAVARVFAAYDGDEASPANDLEWLESMKHLRAVAARLPSEARPSPTEPKDCGEAGHPWTCNCYPASPSPIDPPSQEDDQTNGKATS